MQVIEQHPCRANRKSAAWHAADVADPSLKTEAMLTLRRALDAVLESADDDVIVSVLARYSGRSPHGGVERLAGYLDHEDAALALSALHALLGVASPFHLRAVRVLRSWMAVDRPVDMLLCVVPALGDLVDRGIVKDVCRRALANESPRIRLDAVRRLLPMLGDDGRDLAAAAIVEEPDPAIARLLLAAAQPAP